MTATAAKPARRPGRQSSTLTRVCRRSAVVLGFGALTWAAFTGTAMALDSQDGATAPSPTAESPAPGPGISLDTTLGDVTKPLTTHLTEPLTTSITKPLTKPVTDKLTSTGTDVDRTLRGQPATTAPDTDRQIGTPQHTAPTGGRNQQDPLTTATTVVGDHLGATLHTLSHPASTQPTQPTQPTQATQATQATQPTGSAPGAADVPDMSPAETGADTTAAPAGTTQLSLTSLTRGVEDAAGDLTGSLLTTTHLDQALPAPQLHVLSDTLGDLGVDSALPALTIPQLPLPTEPLRSLPVVGDSVGDVISALPIVTDDLPVPGSQTGTGSGTGTDDTQPGTGPQAAGAPVATDSIAPASPIQPVAVGAVPTLPALLPVGSPVTSDAAQDEPSALSRPDEPSLLSGTPTAYSSLGADGQQGADMDELAAALASLGQLASDGSLPVPAPTQQGPDGHQGGGTTGAGHQDRGDVATFRLPDAVTTSPVRTGRWVLQTAPPSDPGFSPD